MSNRKKSELGMILAKIDSILKDNEAINLRLDNFEKRFERLEELSHEQPDMLKNAMELLKYAAQKNQSEKPSKKPRIKATRPGVRF